MKIDEVIRVLQQLRKSAGENIEVAIFDGDDRGMEIAEITKEKMNSFGEITTEGSATIIIWPE